MNRLTVLMYHDIIARTEWPASGAGPVRNAQGAADVLPPPLYVWRDVFEQQMEVLARDYHVVSPQHVVDFYTRGTELPDRAVLLTFDDLWKSGMTTAHSVLSRWRLPALAFLVRGWVFSAPQPVVPASPVCLADGEWQPMGDVFAFGNHTDKLHTRGPEGPAMLTVAEDDFVADLRRCEEWTTLKRVFAYPFGAVGAGVLAGLRREGYALAFSTEPGVNDISTDPLRLRRNLVPRDLPLDEFPQLLEQ